MMPSIFDLFKVGVGPSSSHTVGPMVAARRYLLELEKQGQLTSVHKLRVDLYGSLALTGEGHGTASAVLLGLRGDEPSLVDVAQVPTYLHDIASSGKISLLGQHVISFSRRRQLRFNKQINLPQHPNGVTFTAFDDAGLVLSRQSYFSVGGGFVLSEQEMATTDPALLKDRPAVPYEFATAEELLTLGEQHQLSIADMIMANEQVLCAHEDIDRGIANLWQVMSDCIDRGCAAHGDLPGGLGVRRRAFDLHQKLEQRQVENDGLALMDWVNLFALAVNEENAVGGRVVTAPTNGAAGVIPAVIAYYCRFVQPTSALSLQQGLRTFMLTATAIGILFKKNASISAAEVGCQGEVGVACSMAAAGLAAVLGGNNLQIENAAEIGMEHNLGLTCDPVGGLVQIPCIERNTMGAVQAINAARLALCGDGSHLVSLDQVIETMHQTGLDMQAKYKETSLGGLAVNLVEC